MFFQGLGSSTIYGNIVMDRGRCSDNYSSKTVMCDNFIANATPRSKMWTTFAATSRDRSFRSFLTLKILLHLAVVLLRAFTLSHDVDVGVWVPSTVMCQSQDKIYLRRNSYYHKKSLKFWWKHLKISFKTARNISLKPLNPAFNRNMLHSRLTQSSSSVVMGRVGHELCSYDSGLCRCRQSGWGQSVVHGRVGCHFPKVHMLAVNRVCKTCSH